MFGCQDNPIWLVALLAAIFLGKICLGNFLSQKKVARYISCVVTWPLSFHLLQQGPHFVEFPQEFDRIKPIWSFLGQGFSRMQIGRASLPSTQ